MTRGLKLRGEHLARFQRRDGKGDERGRHIEIEERAGHGVLAADGGSAELKLGVHRAEQGGKGLAPALRLGTQLLEKLLEGEVGFLVVGTGGNELRHRGVDRVVCADVGIGTRLLRVAAPGHDAGLIRLLTGQDREHGSHRLRGGALRPAAVRHQDRARADGAVKALHETAAGGAAEAGGHLAQGAEAGLRQRRAILARHAHTGVLDSAVGVEEGTAEVGDDRTVPLHDHAGVLGDDGHLIRLEVFRLGGADEGICVLGGNDHGHALLRFGDGKLRAVETVVLLAHGIQIDAQTVGQLADGHADAARAEVVAALDEAGHVAVAEQALDLALLGRVALLHLGGHGRKRFQVVALGRAGRTTDAVTARAAAQQDDHIAGRGALAADVVCRSGRHHGAAFQTLGDVALVIDLRHMTGGKADLVAVGGVARGGSLAQLALRQLAGQRLVERDSRVARAGHAHGLMHIGAAGERVADAAADAGGRAAEGLDLGGVVVGLVFEHQQPVLRLAVDRGGDVDGAGVDLLALVELRQQAALFQGLCADGGDVHEGLGALGCLFLAVDLHARGQIPLVGGLDRGIVDLHVVDVGGEGGVAAVIGPVSVHHADLGDGGLAALIVAEIALQERQIVQIHGETELITQRIERSAVHRGEALHGAHGGGDVILHAQRLRQLQRCLAALDGVDDILLDRGDLGIRQLALERIHARGAHKRTLALRQNLHTLCGGIGALVILTGQILHGKHRVALRQRVRHDVELGLGQHRFDGVVEQLPADALEVIAVEQAQPRQGLDAQKCPQILQQGARLVRQRRLLFYVYSVNHACALSLHCSSALRARWPMSWR